MDGAMASIKGLDGEHALTAPPSIYGRFAYAARAADAQSTSGGSRRFSGDHMSRRELPYATFHYVVDLAGL